MSDSLKAFHNSVFKDPSFITDKKKRILGLIVLYIAVFSTFLTIFGQMPYFSERSMTKLFQIGWLIILVPMLLLNYKQCIRGLIHCLIVAIPFGIYLIVAYCLKVNSISYQATSLIFISILMFFIGMYFGKIYNTSVLKSIAISYLISAFFYSLIVYLTKLHGHFGDKEIFAFNDKNSAGVIFFIAALLGFYIFNKKNVIHYILKIIIFIWFMFVLVGSKSRASLVFSPIAILLIHWFLPKNKTSKILSRTIFTAALAAGIAAIFLVPSLYQRIVVHILMNDKQTFKEAFSGRFEQIAAAFKALNTIPKILIGNGGKYIDCMPISFVLTYGAIGLFTMLPIILLPCVSVCKSRKYLKNHSLFLVELLIVIMLYFNSIFEGLGMFGPGTKVFVAWICSGFSYSLVVSNKAFVLSNTMDRPAQFCASIKMKPFTIVFSCVLLLSSSLYLSSTSTVNGIGKYAFDLLPLSEQTASITVADKSKMKIDTDWADHHIPRNNNSESNYITYKLCGGQTIQFKDTWENKDNCDESIRRWFSSMWDPRHYDANVISVDPLTGIVHAKTTDEYSAAYGKPAILYCNFYSGGNLQCVFVKVVNPNEQTFDHTMIDIKPITKSFESETSGILEHNTSENPIILNAGYTQKLYYDENYLPKSALNNISVTFKLAEASEECVEINGDILKAKKANETPFAVYAEIKRTDGTTWQSENKIWFKINTPTVEPKATGKVIGIKNENNCYQYQPFKVEPVFDNDTEEIDRAIDISVIGPTNTINKETNEITFTKPGSAKIYVTPRSTRKTYTFTIKNGVQTNAPIKFKCNTNWATIGQKFDNKSLGLYLVFQNGYEKLVDDDDLTVINNNFGTRASKTNSGLCSGKLTSFMAVKSGNFSYTYISKINPALTYTMSITSSIYTKAQYDTICANTGVLISFVFISLATIFLLALDVKKVWIYLIATVCYVVTILILTFALYSFNTFTIGCALAFVSIAFFLSILRVALLEGKPAKLFVEN